MIEPSRIQILNDSPVQKNREFVLYWMQASQRAFFNHALEYAIQRANEQNKPLITILGLTADYPGANLRHYHFMLHGLKETAQQLRSRGICFALINQPPHLAAQKYAKRASEVITDHGPLRHQKKWRQYVANNVECRLTQVETDSVVPIELASDKQEYAARTIRPKISKHIPAFLKPLPLEKPKNSSLDYNLKSLDISDPDKLLTRLDIDKSVQPVTTLQPGTTAAQKLLKDFIKNKLDHYDTKRNDPSLGYQSNISPYLHFGQISPVYIALEINKTNSPGKDAYLEELIIRRELARNFTNYATNYDSSKCLPPWAQTTLNFHKKDKRQYIYPRAELEKARTHDPYWNAAQTQMTLTGKMHGYMRMYWGKKILEWSKTPEDAYNTALHLNDKYELDGRDPNGYAGVAWCFGLHDRAWPSHKIYGKIRYMADSGLKRKFDIETYVKNIEQLKNSTKNR
jgi:deoxyribodipyrimidine photo-lyase